MSAGVVGSRPKGDMYVIGLSPTLPGKIASVRLVVAVSSRVEAVEAFRQAGFSFGLGYLKAYAAASGNPAEVEAAMSQPGKVFMAERGKPYELVVK